MIKRVLLMLIVLIGFGCQGVDAGDAYMTLDKHLKSLNLGETTVTFDECIMGGCYFYVYAKDTGKLYISQCDERRCFTKLST